LANAEFSLFIDSIIGDFVSPEFYGPSLKGQFKKTAPFG
jgi:hypothetical protein